MLKHLCRLALLTLLLLGGGRHPAAAQAPGTPPLPPLPADLQASLRLNSSPTNYATAMQLAGVAYYAKGDTAGALAYARLAAHLAQRSHNAVLLAQTYDVFSNCYYLTGQLPQALRYAQLELTQWGNRPEAAGAHNLTGYIYIKMGRTADALAALDRAYRAFGQARNTRSQLLVDNARGGLYLRDEQLDSASLYLVRAARGFHRLQPPDPKNAAQESAALGNLATLAFRQQRRADALSYARQALAVDVASHNLLQQTVSLTSVARCLLDVDSLPQALATARQALALARQTHRLDSEKAALLHLGTYYTRTHQPDSAEANILRAVALSKKGGMRISQGQALIDLANLYYGAHRPADALRQAQAVDALDSAARDPSTTLASLRLLGQLAQDRHDEAAALGYFRRQRALELRQAAAASSKQMAALRVRFGTERTEQQLGLLQARSQAQAQQTELLRLLAAQREGAYRDTLNRRAQRQQQERLRQQLGAQQQAALAERTGQQVLALTQRNQAQAQQARLQQQALRLAAQQQELTRLRTRQQQAGGAALLLLVLAGAGGLLWQYRRRQAARQATRETALRQRLAADLHDDVGHLLTQISLQSSLLRENPHSPAQTLERLDQLTATARQATQQMSDVVWGLHQPAHSLPVLLDRLRDHAHEVLYPLGIEVDFETAPAVAAVALTPEALHGLYLIFKESLHNVVKHAQATRVTVRLTATPAGLRLSVADNGQGQPDPARATGHGLRNMQTRAQAVGGTVRYEALTPGFGVVVALPAGATQLARV